MLQSTAALTLPPELPAVPGTYLLWLRLAAPTRLAVGRLGDFTLAAGGYVYAGSARGPGGLRARVGRHLRPNKRPHWHIDRLTVAAPVVAVWAVASQERLECVWAAALRQQAGVTVPVVGFGASDCACPAHLLALPQDMTRARITAGLAAVSPGPLLLY